jgi:hypothetical protein
MTTCQMRQTSPLQLPIGFRYASEKLNTWSMLQPGQRRSSFAGRVRSKSSLEYTASVLTSAPVVAQTSVRIPAAGSSVTAISPQVMTEGSTRNEHMTFLVLTLRVPDGGIDLLLPKVDKNAGTPKAT